MCPVVTSHAQHGMQVAICPVRHVREELNGPGGFYTGPIEAPFQARHVACRALSPEREVLIAYETSMHCSEKDPPEERARMARMVSQMYR